MLIFVTHLLNLTYSDRSSLCLVVDAKVYKHTDNAYNTSTVNAYNTTTVNAYNTTTFNTYNTSTVNAYNTTTVNAYNTNKQLTHTTCITKTNSLHIQYKQTVKIQYKYTVNKYKSRMLRLNIASANDALFYFSMGADGDDFGGCGDESSIMSGLKAGGKSEFSCCSVRKMRAFLAR